MIAKPPLLWRRIQTRGREQLSLQASRGDEGQQFGEWLCSQAGRSGWIGGIAAEAAKDRAFPRRGDPEAVRRYFNTMGADGDAHEALDDAEAEWAADCC